MVVCKAIPCRFSEALNDIEVAGSRLALADVHGLAVGSGEVLVATISAGGSVERIELGHLYHLEVVGIAFPNSRLPIPFSVKQALSLNFLHGILLCR